MSEEIIKVIDNLSQKFGIAIDWTSANILPYLQNLMGRFIQYRNAMAIIQIVLALIALIIAVMCIKKLIKWTKTDEYKRDYDNEGLFAFGIAGCLFVVIVCVVLIISNSMGIIQNIYMPEITIINYVKGLT